MDNRSISCIKSVFTQLLEFFKNIWRSRDDIPRWEYLLGVHRSHLVAYKRDRKVAKKEMSLRSGLMRQQNRLRGPVGRYPGPDHTESSLIRVRSALPGGGGGCSIDWAKIPGPRSPLQASQMAKKASWVGLLSKDVVSFWTCRPNLNFIPPNGRESFRSEA